MALKTERFELRLDQDILQRLDNWRTKQSDLPTRAEAVRRLLESGLSTTARQAFMAMKFQILTSCLLPGVTEAISDANVFAWSHEIYPLFDAYQEQWAEPFASQFAVSKPLLEELGKYLDQLWTRRKTTTFYELEDRYQLLERAGEWDRAKLINACRYMRLQRMFDDHFWQAMLKPMEFPTEAQIIDEKFDRIEDVFFG